MAASNGVVPEEAQQAFERALRRDPKNQTARFFSGLAAEQDGRTEEAARLWRALLAEAPPGASWIAPVREALARVDAGAAR